MLALGARDREFDSPKSPFSNLNRHGAGVARRAHNPEVTGSKPVAGIRPRLIGYLVFIQVHSLISTNRRGASAARRAHNPEVTGSTPVAGIRPRS